MEQSATKEELLGILKEFAKDKSPGPDGWTSEFFLSFFDLVGQDLVRLCGGFQGKGEGEKFDKLYFHRSDSERQ
jgi:hypothetical protein